ncbi:MAG TPA: hypothetical protein PK768_05080 [Tepidanaerobacteraceae bacterium]|jgi:hypothetical protein|nr:hypothetical protein [Tepidanaerobacteraceae bacterium]
MAKIFVRPDGRIEGLYTDTVPLKDLGHLNVRRATHVEFCEKRQEWVVTLPDGTEVHHDPSREKALEWERTYCEKKLLEGYRVI